MKKAMSSNPWLALFSFAVAFSSSVPALADPKPSDTEIADALRKLSVRLQMDEWMRIAETAKK